MFQINFNVSILNDLLQFVAHSYN